MDYRIILVIYILRASLSYYYLDEILLRLWNCKMADLQGKKCIQENSTYGNISYYLLNTNQRNVDVH